MGFTIQDTVTVPVNGVETKDLTVTCNSFYRVRKATINEQTKYYAKTVFKYFVDTTKSPIWNRGYEIEIALADLDSNVVTKLYNTVKAEYTDTTDV
jgi:hypothetical protein